MKMDKRGSHVGMVISFVVFITFIVFLYSIIQPTLKLNQDKEVILEHLKDEIVNNVSGELITNSFRINNSDNIIPPDSKCFKINSGLEDYNIGSVVLDEAGIVGSGISEGGFLNVNGSDIKDKFYRVYYSKEFSNNINGLKNCYEINSANYTINSLRTDKAIFESRILMLINNYYKDYNSLKVELGVPGDSEFSFGFINKEGKEIKTTDRNVSVNVYADKIDVKYIDNNASINDGYINIKVW